VFAKVRRVCASPRRVCIVAAASTPLGAMRATKHPSSISSISVRQRAVGPPLSAYSGWETLHLTSSPGLVTPTLYLLQLLYARCAAAFRVSSQRVCSLLLAPRAARGYKSQNRSTVCCSSIGARALFKRGEPWKQSSRDAGDRLQS